MTDPYGPPEEQPDRPAAPWAQPSPPPPGPWQQPPPPAPAPAWQQPPPPAWQQPPPPWPQPAWSQQTPQQAWQQPPWSQQAWQQPPWPAQGWYGAPQPRTNGLAVASLVTGLVGLIPVGIGLGIGALVQIRNRGETGHGLAIGGIVASGVWALLVGVFVAIGVSGGFDSPGRVGSRTDIASSSVGTCLHAHPSMVTDCASPHEEEVYLAVPVPRTDWPGQEEVDTVADDLCHGAFEDYVGSSYYDSAYDYAFYAPDQVEWDNGVRELVCVVVPFDDDHLIGSVKGSGD